MLLLAGIGVLAGCQVLGPAPTPLLDGAGGVTEWQVGDDNIPDAFTRGTAAFARAQDLVDAVLAEATGQGLPPGARLWSDVQATGSGSAVGIIQLANAGDDSVAGQEIRLRLLRDPAGWYIDAIAYRSHCRRGVDPSGDFCV